MIKWKQLLVFVVLMWLGMWFGGWIFNQVSGFIPASGGIYLTGALSALITIIPGYFLVKHFQKKLPE
jgi:DNA-binding transcriptional regulator of glucitol operon